MEVCKSVCDSLSLCSVQVIVAPQRRKQIQQYMLSGGRFVHMKDYSIPEPACAMVSQW